jgi:hypothetical protein
MVVRMISGRWIISHRCSWITVYVLCCNAQVNLIVILMTYTCFLYSINCPTVICLPSMLFIFMRDTSSELWTSVHSFTFILPFTFTRIIYFLAKNYLLPHDMFNPLFTANRWDWQPHCKLGQSTLVVLCAGSTLLLVQSYDPYKAPYINCLELSPSQLASTFGSWFFLLLVR